MVPLSQLAEMLECSEKVVQKLIRIGYLKRGRGKGRGRLIELPPLSALRWLKLMLQPLPLRPLFTLPEIVQMSGLKMGKLREIMLAWNIPIHYDLALGELVSPDSLIQLINALHSLRDPLRLDHAALLAWMQGMSPKNKIRKLLPYSKLIEREIARIAQLSQPERTTQAYQFWKRYKSARFVSHAIDRVNPFVGKKKSQDAEREERIREIELEARKLLDAATLGEGEAEAIKQRKISRRNERASRQLSHPSPLAPNPARSPDSGHAPESPVPPQEGEE